MFLLKHKTGTEERIVLSADLFQSQQCADLTQNKEAKKKKKNYCKTKQIYFNYN